MKNLLQMFYWLCYLAFVAPPRALAIKEKADRNNSELSGRSVLSVSTIEITIRIGLILLLATSIESILGDKLYESLLFDKLFLLLLVTGILHSGIYILCFNLVDIKNSTHHIYRIGRNICYTVLVAVGIELICNALELFKIFQFDERLLQILVLSGSVITFVIGVIEAFVAVGAPSAIDNTIKDKI